jgi:hypothetical protein
MKGAENQAEHSINCRRAMPVSSPPASGMDGDGSGHTKRPKRPPKDGLLALTLADRSEDHTFFCSAGLASTHAVRRDACGSPTFPNSASGQSTDPHRTRYLTRLGTAPSLQGIMLLRHHQER